MTLHKTQSIKAEDMRRKHVGGLMGPPDTLERLEELGPLQEKTFEVGV